MVALVVCLNTAIALLGFYAAWRIWRLKQAVAAATAVATAWEQEIGALLTTQTMTGELARAHQVTKQLQGRVERLLNQLKLVQQLGVVALVGWRLLRRDNPKWLKRLRIR